MRTVSLSPDGNMAGENRPKGQHPRPLRTRTGHFGAGRGALLGLAVGLLALGADLAIASRCLPFRISFPPPPWPWYCTDPAYGAIGYLAFPVNLLTNDLARAVPLAPLSLLLYILLGALLGGALGISRSPAPRA